MATPKAHPFGQAAAQPETPAQTEPEVTTPTPESQATPPEDSTPEPEFVTRAELEQFKQELIRNSQRATS